jgi:phosphatidylinositol alpha-mannosyltransferase
LVELIRDPESRRELARRGRRRADVFDWSVVASDVMAVYETVSDGAARVRPSGEGASRWARLLRSGRPPLG